VCGSNEPKGINRIATICKIHLCLREENLEQPSSGTINIEILKRPRRA
jgi:hypothetical protein